MIYLVLSAEISPNKLLEFNQSKLTFINGLHDIKGYSGFTEKRSIVFQMKISWLNLNCLEDFLGTEHYKFFRGAILTLSCQNEISIVSDDLKRNIEMN